MKDSRRDIRILSLDTTSKNASVSISEGMDIRGEYNFFTVDNLSSSLVAVIDFVLKNANLELSEIDLFGIGTGPGLFTGIRVGLSTLKGLLLKSPKPVVPVVVLEALAYKHKSDYPGYHIISLIDARRDEVYTAVYHFPQGKLKEATIPRLMHVEKLKEYLNLKDRSPLLFVGSGAVAHKDFLEENVIADEGKNMIISTNRSPFLASEMCRMSYQAYLNNRFVSDLQDLNPFYMRRPDAEQNFKEIRRPK